MNSKPPLTVHKAAVPKHGTIAEVFGAPEAAPMCTACVFPEWQDEHHPRDIAIRWAPPHDRDELHPWLILGSDGPQVLSNDSVANCEWLPLQDVANELAHPTDHLKVPEKAWAAGMEAVSTEPREAEENARTWRVVYRVLQALGYDCGETRPSGGS